MENYTLSYCTNKHNLSARPTLKKEAQWECDIERREDMIMILQKEDKWIDIELNTSKTRTDE